MQYQEIEFRYPGEYSSVIDLLDHYDEAITNLSKLYPKFPCIVERVDGLYSLVWMDMDQQDLVDKDNRVQSIDTWEDTFEILDDYFAETYFSETMNDSEWLAFFGENQELADDLEGAFVLA